MDFDYESLDWSLEEWELKDIGVIGSEDLDWFSLKTEDTEY